MDAAAEADLPPLADAVVGLADVSRTFDESRLRRVTAVVVGGSPGAGGRAKGSPASRRRPGLGAVSCPKAEHHLHLTHPEEVLDVARGLVQRVGV